MDPPNRVVLEVLDGEEGARKYFALLTDQEAVAGQLHVEVDPGATFSSAFRAHWADPLALGCAADAIEEWAVDFDLQLESEGLEHAC